MTTATLAHPLDQISLGTIVQIRERLMGAQAAGKRVFRFESGDPNFAPAPHVTDALARAANAGKTHYVPIAGIPELRQAIADKVAVKNRMTGVRAEDVFITNGAMHGLYVAFQSLLRPGDEVIVPDPMWTEVVENIRLAGGVPVGVPLRAEQGFQYNPDAIARAITSRTTAIFVNTPHNPTGAVLDLDALRAIVAVAERHGLWIISDEAYEDVIYAPHVHHSLAALIAERRAGVPIVTVFSFSKSYAMSGLRTGCLITRSHLLHDRLPKILRCTINGVNSATQWAGVAAVTGSQEQLSAMRDEYQVRRDLMMRALSNLDGVRPHEPAGGFFIWAEIGPSVYDRLEVDDAEGLSDLLAADGIGSAPGRAFGHACPDALRFSFSCSTEMVREGADVLRARLLD
jgi:aspartate aminotransferase